MVGCARTLTDREVKIYASLMPSALARKEIETPRFSGPESIAEIVLMATGNREKAAAVMEKARQKTQPYGA